MNQKRLGQHSPGRLITLSHWGQAAESSRRLTRTSLLRPSS